VRAAIARHDTRIANLQYIVQTDADADLRKRERAWVSVGRVGGGCGGGCG
jgi:hypothetical protein